MHSLYGLFSVDSEFSIPFIFQALDSFKIMYTRIKWSENKYEIKIHLFRFETQNSIINKELIVIFICLRIWQSLLPLRLCFSFLFSLSVYIRNSRAV